MESKTMAIMHTGSAMGALGRLLTMGTATAMAEAELLERFVSQGDPAAFEVLLQRHGPMVLRVCQRILDDPNDADDAFQATFLILVKKAASIREREVLGTWLYGVARRVAVRARVNTRRRNSRERSDLEAIAVEKPRDNHVETRELRVLIDDELERLPYRYRGPLVLCDLEGQTHEQAAAQLRCPVGTVKSRLSRGRERLRDRLIRRGVVPAGALASFLATEAASAVPIELVTATVRTATQVAARKTATAGMFSVYVANLVDGVMRSMMISKLRFAAGAILAASVAIAGVQTLVVAARVRPALVLEQAPNAVQENVAIKPPVNKEVRPAEPGSERFVLDNGLTVIMRPIKGAESTALVVLYSIGSDHDPAGKSGLGHLLEHTYVTAAAGQASARSAEEFASRYPEGANGQTGDRYTVFAAVFPRKDLETELKDAAARMGDLRLGAGDLARERPRLLEEVANMFGDFPTLAASNHARELIRPTPGGGRRGGLPAHVNALTLEELQDHWKRYYKPRNAIMILSGAIDPIAIRELITANFAPIAPGEQIPTPSEPAPPNGLGRIMALAVRSPVPDAQSMACVAYAAPAPGSELYAPFLVLASRLSARAFMLGATGPTGSPVYFTPLDDGAVISISTTPKPEESTSGTFKRLEDFVAQTIEAKLGMFERMTARRQFGPFLGLVESPDSVLINNPYGVAFSLGRREQWKLKSADLITACDSVTDDQIRRAAREVFAPDRRARAIIAVEK
jgi:zinc protease